MSGWSHQLSTSTVKDLRCVPLLERQEISPRSNLGPRGSKSYDFNHADLSFLIALVARD